MSIWMPKGTVVNMGESFATMGVSSEDPNAPTVPNPQIPVIVKHAFGGAITGPRFGAQYGPRVDGQYVEDNKKELVNLVPLAHDSGKKMSEDI